MECAICYEPVTENTGKIQLSCSHSFHIGCGTKWFVHQIKMNHPESCPVCRHETTESEKIPRDIVHKYEYTMGSRKEIHDLLVRFGGKGINNTLWNNLKKHPNSYVRTELVMNRDELEMLMITNACKKLITTEQWFLSLHDIDDWYGVNPTAA